MADTATPRNMATHTTVDTASVAPITTTIITITITTTITTDTITADKQTVRDSVTVRNGKLPYDCSMLTLTILDHFLLTLLVVPLIG